jgi:hypothetical protein
MIRINCRHRRKTNFQHHIHSEARQLTILSGKENAWAWDSPEQMCSAGMEGLPARVQGAGGRCDHTRRFDIALAAIVLLGATLVGAEQPVHPQACTTNATNGGIVQSGGSCALAGDEVR